VGEANARGRSGGSGRYRWKSILGNAEQIVKSGQDLLYYKLSEEFGRQTGVPVLLSTSLNEDEPLLCAPDQAVSRFLQDGYAGLGAFSDQMDVPALS